MKLTQQLIHILLLFTLASVASFSQENLYVTPQYTKVYGNQIENLKPIIDANALGGNGFELTFSDIKNHFSSQHDGMMVYYEPNIKKGGNANTLLMRLLADGRSIVDFFYQGNSSSLTIRRYDPATSKYIDYHLFDKMVSEIGSFPVYKIYFSKNFIWIEDGIMLFQKAANQHPEDRGHSPLFWGLDIGASSVTSLFLNKSSSAKLQLFQPYRSIHYIKEDIQVYGFNTTELLKELNTNFANATATTRARRSVDSDAIEDEANQSDAPEIAKQIYVYPNPTSDGIFTIQWEDNIHNLIRSFSVQPVLHRGDPLVRLAPPSSSNSVVGTIASFPPGLYIVSCELKDGRVVRIRLLKN